MPKHGRVKTMKITSAEFVKGAVGGEGLPTDGLPHIAFVGRSNVGKSSLINLLTGRRDLAISSSTPGRTLQLNFFRINEKVHFVDLPGYGYSKVSAKHADKMRRMILWYFEYSEVKPKHVVLVIDAKVGFTEFDEEMLAVLMSHQHPVVIVANKIDKLTQSEFSKQRNEIAAKAHGNPVCYVSSKTKKGRDELLDILFS